MNSFINSERAQAMQIGFILIFGLLVISLALYQANVVPDQNRNAEITHSNNVDSKFSSLTSNIFNTGMSGSPSVKTFDMGMNYQNRLLTINPAPPSARLYTTSPRPITISNSSMEHTIPTRYLEYDVEYRLYDDSPIYTAEQAFSYRKFEDSQTSVSKTPFILNDGFAIVALQGNYNETRSTSVRTQIEQTDSLKKYTITDPEITVPTKLDEQHWLNLEEDISNLEIDYDDSVRDNTRVTISRSGEMELYVTSVSLSDRADGGVNHDNINLPESTIDSAPGTGDTGDTGEPIDPDRPPAEEVYNIREEPWIDDDQRIFEVLQGYNPTWDFGDGTTSNEFYVEHRYDSPGTYDVQLTVTIDGDQYTYTDVVTIQEDIDLNFDADEIGDSGNYIFSWSTEPTTSDSSVSFYLNGELVESDLSQSNSDYRHNPANAGDEVEIRLIDSSGDILSTESIML